MTAKPIQQNNVDELLKPRVKCIGDKDNHYPNSPFEVGEIIHADERGEFNYYTDNGRYRIAPEAYPHLFKPLAWWEDRKESEMPEYVRNNTKEAYCFGEVYKVGKWNSLLTKLYFNQDEDFMFVWDTLPATEAEYINYKKPNQ
jgi:hypothetical protein